jgi:hypothetical protein
MSDLLLGAFVVILAALLVGNAYFIGWLNGWDERGKSK